MSNTDLIQPTGSRIVQKLREAILSAGLCVEDNDNGERICGRHDYRWEQTELVCNGVLSSMDELFASKTETST